jgi:predicted metal-binding membrane protein
MNAAWLIVAGIFAVWGAAVMMLYIADWTVQRRYVEQLQVRDWTEKVEAMRRMHDQEGEA